MSDGMIQIGKSWLRSSDIVSISPKRVRSYSDAKAAPVWSYVVAVSLRHGDGPWLFDTGTAPVGDGRNDHMDQERAEKATDAFVAQIIERMASAEARTD